MQVTRSLRPYPWPKRGQRGITGRFQGRVTRLLSFVAILLALSACTTVAPIDYSWSGDEKDKQGDYTGAIADYSQAIQLEPGVPGLYWSRAHAYDKIGDYDRAIADY